MSPEWEQALSWSPPTGSPMLVSGDIDHPAAVDRAITHTIPQLEELEAAMGATAGLVTNLTVAVYSVVIVLTLVFQGLNARYYFARIKLVQGYLEETPAWIIDLQRATAVL